MNTVLFCTNQSWNVSDFRTVVFPATIVVYRAVVTVSNIKVDRLPVTQP